MTARDVADVVHVHNTTAELSNWPSFPQELQANWPSFPQELQAGTILSQPLAMSSMSVVVTVGPKCTLAVASMPTGQTDGQTSDHYIMFSARHGQCNNRSRLRKARYLLSYPTNKASCYSSGNNLATQSQCTRYTTIPCSNRLCHKNV